MKKQTGFTLIELVVVIVILGILAATALPKFIDLSGDAEKAAVQGVAGSLSSAASVNYAGYKVSAKGTAISGAATCTSTAVTGLVQGVTLGTGTPADSQSFKIAQNGSPADCSTSGNTMSCTLTSKNNYSAVAYVQCTN